MQADHTYIFQLTTSRGGRPGTSTQMGTGFCISTHDLARRSTFQTAKSYRLSTISTHDLARRSTVLLFSSSNLTIISTHDLARRSTSPEWGARRVAWNFNSRPRKEVDSNFYAKSFPFKITFCAHCI